VPGPPIMRHAEGSISPPGLGEVGILERCLLGASSATVFRRRGVTFPECKHPANSWRLGPSETELSGVWPNVWGAGLAIRKPTSVLPLTASYQFRSAERHPSAVTSEIILSLTVAPPLLATHHSTFALRDAGTI
jgi:hypothetical protein